MVPLKGTTQDVLPTVAALARQDYPEHLIDLVVVDNASDPPVDELAVKEAGARLVRQPEGGSYAARNAGAASADADVLAFTDADCLPDPTWLSELVEPLQQDEETLAVGGVIDLTFAEGRPETPAGWYERLFAFDQARNVSRSRFSVTASLAVRRSAFDTVGGFDDAALSGGDLQFCRALLADRPDGLAFARAARVQHPAREDMGALLRKTRRTGAGVELLRRRTDGRMAVRAQLVVLRRLVRRLASELRTAPTALGEGGPAAVRDVVVAVLTLRGTRFYDALVGPLRTTRRLETISRDG